jgi:hypothetical protein
VYLTWYYEPEAADADYFACHVKFSKGMRSQHRVPEGENWDETIFNVFKRTDGVTRHFWGSEMSFAPTVPKSTPSRWGIWSTPCGVCLI